MKKTLLKEFILPSFWLFFFIVSPKSEDRTNDLKQGNKIELKKQGDIFAASEDNKTKKIRVTRAVYLSGF